MLNRILPLAAALAFAASPAAFAHHGGYHGPSKGKGGDVLAGVIIGGIVGGAIASSVSNKSGPWCAEHRTYHVHDDHHDDDHGDDHHDGDHHDDDHGGFDNHGFDNRGYNNGYRGGVVYGQRDYYQGRGYSTSQTRYYGGERVQSCHIEYRRYRDGYGAYISKKVKVCY